MISLGYSGKTGNSEVPLNCLCFMLNLKCIIIQDSATQYYVCKAVPTSLQNVLFPESHWYYVLLASLNCH